MSEPSTKPYLIRAIFDWCADAGYTPYLAVQVDEYTQVPMAYVKDGKIVLNIGMDAVRNLQLGNEDITCGGRFGGRGTPTYRSDVGSDRYLRQRDRAGAGVSGAGVFAHRRGDRCGRTAR